MIRYVSVALLAAFIALFAAPAIAHDHKVTVQHKGKTIEKSVDFTGWKGGKNGNEDCCDGRHCRAATSFRQLSDGKWEFTVPVSPGLPKPNMHKVIVPDDEVTKDKPDDDGIAYWCGDFYQDRTTGKFSHYNRCAFIPKLKS